MVLSAGEVSKAPKVFMMSPCESPPGSLIVGCLATEFSPTESVRFKWLDQRGNALTDFIQYPTIGSKDKMLKYIQKFNVTVDTKKWFDGEIVTCTIRDTNNNRDIKQEISFKKGDGKNPSDNIYKPESMNTETVSHVCEVTSPKLGDVYITWKMGGQPYIEGRTSAPIHQNNYMSALSILFICCSVF
ncbi:Ig mu chain C region [Labeo rohita]|uniref:Ig mu chain C region n=1 Tax=Labeo rohita TaxID=84645 RepID=A0ABQ8MTQ0_LABRO|nr:Ig mu chain C region [Labeo rohita]